MSSYFEDTQMNAIKSTLLLWLVLSFIVIRADDWKTLDGTIYRDVKIVNQDNAFVTILDHDGGAKIAISNLPPDLQKKLNYDPKAAKEQLESEKAEQDKEAEEKKKKTILGGQQTNRRRNNYSSVARFRYNRRIIHKGSVGTPHILYK